MSDQSTDKSVTSNSLPGIEPSDLELVSLVQKGEKSAFKVLVDRYQQRVFRLVLSKVKNEQDAEDVTQEVFVKAYLSIKDFKGNSKFYTWLFRIAFNMAVDFLRKARRIDRLTDTVEENMAQDTAPAADEVYSNREELKKVSDILNTFPEEQKSILLLREVEGLSYEEIAETTGLKRGTVMSRLFYARKRLQEVLFSQKNEDSSASTRPKVKEGKVSGLARAGDNLGKTIVSYFLFHIFYLF